MKERGWIIVLFGVVGLGLALLYYRVLLSVIPEDSWLLDYTYGSGRRKDLLMSICLPLSGLFHLVQCPQSPFMLYKYM